jgi:competence protein ComEA
MSSRPWEEAMRDRVVGLWHRVRSGEDPVAFGAVVVAVALVAGVLWFWAGARHGGLSAASAAPGRPAPVARDPLPPAFDDRRTTTTSPVLAVHVAGAVARPGLYHLPAGSRVADALAQAGGKLPGADLDRLNLAARLVDGQKVLVSRRGEPVVGEGDGGGGAAGVVLGQPATAVPAEPIDLNTADLAALDSLPGIGPATARAILEERARRGGFRSTRDLLRVPGIGEGRFARLKDRVRV